MMSSLRHFLIRIVNRQTDSLSRRLSIELDYLNIDVIGLLSYKSDGL